MVTFAFGSNFFHKSWAYALKKNREQLVCYNSDHCVFRGIMQVPLSTSYLSSVYMIWEQTVRLRPSPVDSAIMPSHTAYTRTNRNSCDAEIPP